MGNNMTQDSAQTGTRESAVHVWCGDFEAMRVTDRTDPGWVEYYNSTFHMS